MIPSDADHILPAGKDPLLGMQPGPNEVNMHAQSIENNCLKPGFWRGVSSNLRQSRCDKKSKQTQEGVSPATFFSKRR
jgi:hypothetical protein